MPSSVASALAVLALLTTPAIAHSWVEQMMVISPSGAFTGQPGFARNNTMRTAPGFTDLLMVHILPGQGQPAIEQRQVPSPDDVQNIQPTDPMCKKTQQSQFQSAGSPRLKAAPGDMVALRYEENGHVTLPNNQLGKPANRGNVSIYGTTQPKDGEKFLDIYGVWNADGSGGDKRGKLLATQPFDDGQCYQVNGGPISAERQKQFPHAASQVGGTDLWCQNDIKIPTDAPSGKPYTLYWVWDWPTLPNVDPNLPKGKAEIYTTCMDVDVTGTKATRDLEDRQAPSSGSNINNMAIPAYVKQLNAAPAAAAPSSTPAASPAKLAVAPIASSPAAAPSVAPQSPSVAPIASSPAAAPSVAPQSPSVVTVTVTATPAAQPAAQPTTLATMASPAIANSASAPASQAAAQPPANSMPPSSLQIAAPVVSGPAANLPTFTGTASAVTPSLMPTYSVPKNASTPVAVRQCNKCKKQKRSLILGAAAH